MDNIEQEMERAIKAFYVEHGYSPSHLFLSPAKYEQAKAFARDMASFTLQTVSTVLTFRGLKVYPSNLLIRGDEVVARSGSVD